MKIRKFCIVFSGAIGSSKTPISNFLSGKLNLPILCNDSLRIEITEDLGGFDEKAYASIVNKRLKEILREGISFIYDASIDRSWEFLRENGQDTNFS